jgi:hypothetical protein
MAAPLVAAGIGAAGSALGGWMANQGNRETKMQRKQRKTVDELIASLYGQGQFSNLFNMDEEAFQKSYVEPAMQMWNNQVAPQIQQQYISSGLQRGSGMDAALARSGMELDQMLNQQYYQMQQDAMNRQMTALNQILGAGSGAPAQMSSGQAAAQGAAGYFSSPGFGKAAESFGDWWSGGGQQQQSPQPVPSGSYSRKGYADNTEWNRGY